MSEILKFPILDVDPETVKAQNDLAKSKVAAKIAKETEEAKSRYLAFTVNPDNAIDIETKGLSLPAFIQICFVGIHSAVESYIKNATNLTEKQIELMKQDLFDMINNGASTLLDKTFPDISLRPDLTEEAILQAENNIITTQPKKAAECAEAYAKSAEAVLDLGARKVKEAQLKAIAKAKGSTKNYSKKKPSIKQ